jgi:hypothetical protein
MKKITTVAQAGGHSVRVGSAAMGALLSEVMCEQRLHAQKLFRFAPTTSDNSLTLEKREASGVYAEHTPTRPKDEGDDQKLIFSLILTLLSKKIDERMEAKPRATHDKDWFHHIYREKVRRSLPAAVDGDDTIGEEAPNACLHRPKVHPGPEGSLHATAIGS